MNLKKLKRAIHVDFSEVEPYIQRLIEEIKENNQVHGRTDDQLRMNVEMGVVLEVAAEKATGGKLNPFKFDHTNPNSYIWDLEVNGELIEIKYKPRNDVWLNFNIKNEVNLNESRLNRADYSVFSKHCEKLDWLLAGSASKLETGYEVLFEYLIDAKTFKRYQRASKRAHHGTGTTNYYHLKQSMTDGNCIRLT